MPTMLVSSAPVTIYAVIVVYKQVPEQCQSLQSLLAAQKKVPLEDLRLSITVVDNTPGGHPVTQQLALFRYQAYPDNPGLARPYNDALLLAEAEGFDWLLTLDQDTSLPPDYLAGMVKGVRQYGSQQDVAALVPSIYDGEKLISPFEFRWGFLPVVASRQTSGVLGPHASALNSASLLRVDALREIGGYDEAFPLHNSDTRLYQKLDLAGKRTAMLRTVSVSHELSILDRAGRLSKDRYRQMLQDEGAFWDMHMGAAARGERLVRLIGRYCKGILRGEQKTYQTVTFQEIRYRLFRSRKTRVKQRLMHAVASPAATVHHQQTAANQEL